MAEIGILTDLDLIRLTTMFIAHTEYGGRMHLAATRGRAPPVRWDDRGLLTMQAGRKYVTFQYSKKGTKFLLTLRLGEGVRWATR